MLSRACTRRTLLSPVVRCALNPSASRTRCFKSTSLPALPSVRNHNPSSPFQHRCLSASASKRRKRSKRKQPEAPPDKPSSIPKWAATTSVLIVPFMFAAWGVSDWIFGNRTKGHNEGLRHEFVADQRKDNDEMDNWLEQLESKPTLFHCVVRKTSGLTHCLSGVKLGDVVEILEEGVGPDKAYNLCRLPARDEEASLSRDTYGWFPIRWLQKLENYNSMVRQQHGQLLSKRADPEA